MPSSQLLKLTRKGTIQGLGSPLQPKFILLMKTVNVTVSLRGTLDN